MRTRPRLPLLALVSLVLLVPLTEGPVGAADGACGESETCPVAVTSMPCKLNRARGTLTIPSANAKRALALVNRRERVTPSFDAIALLVS